MILCLLLLMVLMIVNADLFDIKIVLLEYDLQLLEPMAQYLELLRSSTLATGYKERDDDDRILVPIKDEDNYIELYGTYLKNQRSVIQPFLKELAKNWPK